MYPSMSDARSFHSGPLENNGSLEKNCENLATAFNGITASPETFCPQG